MRPDGPLKSSRKFAKAEYPVTVLVGNPPVTIDLGTLRCQSPQNLCPMGKSVASTQFGLRLLKKQVVAVTVLRCHQTRRRDVGNDETPAKSVPPEPTAARDPMGSSARSRP